MQLRVTLACAVLAVLVLAAVRSTPNDPFFPQQWGLLAIGAPAAWSLGQGEGVIVAVVDSGVHLGHTDLVDAFVRDADGLVVGWDFVDGAPIGGDGHGHGTMVAGVIAARTGNGYGIASVAPAAEIMPVRVLDADAAGRHRDVEAGIRWAVDHGAHVVNLSLEIGHEVDAPPRQRGHAPDEAVRYAWERGVVVVAAAGNDGSDFTDYPDDSPVVLVGATDHGDVRAPFSDTGRRDMLMAPGVGIISTWCNPCGPDGISAIGESSGTSYAAAHVSGAVALLLATGVESEEAVRILRETAVDLGATTPDPEYGYGRIDVDAAMRSALGLALDDRPRRAAASDPSPVPEPSPGAPSDPGDHSGPDAAAPDGDVRPPPDPAAAGAVAAGSGPAAGVAGLLIVLYAVLFVRWRPPNGWGG